MPMCHLLLVWREPRVSLAGVSSRRRPSADLLHIEELLGEDPAGLGEEGVGLVLGRDRRDEIEIRGDAADGDRPTEELADPLLEVRPAALGDVLEACLTLRGAKGDDVALDADRATGGDERLGRRVLADVLDDVRPAGAELLEG